MEWNLTAEVIAAMQERTGCPLRMFVARHDSYPDSFHPDMDSFLEENMPSVY